ncbi:MAG: sigma-70 family RNA polymerase sigma factor [Phycisphaeraceae bacterium]|nr:MAG: sigma-70 family RNA polymerase sigma factor [Phycisphaeraceae bacterium]
MRAEQPQQGTDGSPPASKKNAVTETLYAELRNAAERMFARERRDHTLQPTALVNEACVRLMAGGLEGIPQTQRIAIAARVLKQVLIDHARAHNADKRGGGALHLELSSDIAADLTSKPPAPIEFERVRAALDRLRDLSERQAEVVTLRILGGMTMDQIASTLGVSKRTVEADWTVARAWLRRELGGDDAGPARSSPGATSP